MTANTLAVYRMRERREESRKGMESAPDMGRIKAHHGAKRKDG
jgi:hypothetical protein